MAENHRIQHKKVILAWFHLLFNSLSKSRGMITLVRVPQTFQSQSNPPMQCPKCQHQQADQNKICQACGIVFTKYFKYNPLPGQQFSEETAIQVTEEAPQNWREILLPEQNEQSGIVIAGRAVLLGLLMIWGNIGKHAPCGFHDWEYLLTETGLIRYDTAIAMGSHVLGSLLIILVPGWGGALLWKQCQSLFPY